MSDISTRIEALVRLPLFAGFTANELAIIAEHCVEREHTKDETLWHAGDAGDEFIIVLSGELVVWGGSGDDERVVALLGPGECLGEIALLLDEPRSATITCSRPARVLVLAKPDFREFIRDDARALAYVSELLSRRVIAATRIGASTRSTTVVGVTAAPGVPGASLVAATTAAMIAGMSRRDVLHVHLTPENGKPLDAVVTAGAETLHSLITQSGDGLHELSLGTPDLADATVGRRLAALVDLLGTQYRAVVLDLPRGPAFDTPLVSEACDVVVELPPTSHPRPAQGSRHTKVFRAINLAHGRCEPIPINRCDPFVLPFEPALMGLDRNAQVAHLLANDRLPLARVLARLSRKILGATVGIALGGGAAFGVSHIGVLEVLEAAGIPVDLVAGTSMGSIVGIGYAGGMSGADMHAVANDFSNLRKTLGALDLSLSGTGLLAGRRLVQTFSPLLPIETFEELVLPCQTVATDVETGERITIGTGNLNDAFRASSSVPLLFAPVRREGRVLVDGAMVDPVPAEIAREMGADIVFGVNVVPRLQRGVRTALSQVFRITNKLNPIAYLNGTVDSPHLVDILMNSLQASQYELGNFKALSADVLINVDMAEFTWIDFLRALEIIERGAEATHRALPEIKRVYEARLGVSVAA